MSVVLMYHGLYPDNDPSIIDVEDLPYAVRVSDFTCQLDALLERNVGLYSQQAAPDIVISFDDGHESNLSLAAPLLQERQLSAYFFVTSGFVNTRKFFLSADELKELSLLPGMCVGSHGKTHRFFDDMSISDSEEELVSSKQALEEITGSAVHAISFPGGRFQQRTLEQLEGVGYTQSFGSKIGIVAGKSWRAVNAPADRWQLDKSSDLKPVERIAIRRNTRMDEFHRIIDQNPGYFRRKQFNSQVKHMARSILGNRLYHGLYKSIAAR